MPVLTRPEGAHPVDFHLTRRGVTASFFAGYAAAGLSAAAEPVHTDETSLIVETVGFPSAGVSLPGYLARPSARGPFPAILLASEIFGIHDYIKDVCRRLAKLGYVALAPAFFVRAGDPAALEDINAVMKIVAKASDQQVMGDVGAAVKFLKAQRFVDPARLAVTGFCWGGGVTWLACETFRDFRAGVAWYGRMVPTAAAPADPNRLWPVAGVSHLHAPVLGLYGAHDPLASSIPAMREALAAAHQTSTEIIIYPDAGHGFHADYRSSYNAVDAQDGWRRMLAFFAANGVAPKA